MPTHPRFNADHWKQEIPLSQLRAAKRAKAEQIAKNDPKRFPTEQAKQQLITTIAPDAEMIYGPREITTFEQLRAEASNLHLRGRAIPTDICVWGLGEPHNPAATKIGGRPLRPPTKPWPLDHPGNPMGFLAQFNFTDSLDILPKPPNKLPGDILQIYISDTMGLLEEDPKLCALEWHSLDPSLTLAADAPNILNLTPTWCELHRTHDYPDSTIDDELNIIQATKFGGAPAYQQGDPELPGRHLCTLSSLNPFGNPWPLLNVPTNSKGEQYLDHNLFMLGDLGAAYFFITSEGAVHWSADCG